MPQVRGDEVCGAFDRGRTRRFRGLAVAGQVDRDDERVLLGAQRQIGEHLAAHPDPVDEDEGARCRGIPAPLRDHARPVVGERLDLAVVGVDGGGVDDDRDPGAAAVAQGLVAGLGRRGADRAADRAVLGVGG